MEKTTISEADHTQDEEVRAYREHLATTLSRETLEALQRQEAHKPRTMTGDLPDPIFSE